MKDTKQLNRLAIEAKGGCEAALWEIRGHFLGFIHNLSDRYWNKIRSQDSFETRCFQRIDEAVGKFDPEKGNFSYQVEYRIYNLLRDQVKRHSRRQEKYSISIHSLNSTLKDKRDNPVEMDVIDELALVDDKVLTNERIALLAEGDSRKLAILYAWSIGSYNDSHTASFLAKRHGGNAESHRKFLTRFRTACKRALA